jgi:acylphosphatase
VVAERRTIHYSGRVQGVGFRWTAVRALGGLAVTGYVRNLRDGRVELVLEGEPAHLEEGARRVREAMSGHIRNEAATPGSATGEFRGFGILRS